MEKKYYKAPKNKTETNTHKLTHYNTGSGPQYDSIYTEFNQPQSTEQCNFSSSSSFHKINHTMDGLYSSH